MMNHVAICVLLIMLVLLYSCDNSDADTEAVSLESGNLILTALHGDAGSAWRLPDCAACHVLDTIHQGAELIRGMVRDKEYVSCTGCHGRNGSDDSEPRRCGLCHNRNDLPQTPWLDGQHAHHFTAEKTGRLNDEQCINCHVAADMDGQFELNRDLTGYPDARGIVSPYGSVSEFCLRCHNRDHQQSGFEIVASRFDDPLVAVEDAFNFIDQHGLIEGSGTRTYAGLRQGYEYRSVVACTDCHAMHGTDNVKLIIDSSMKGVTQLDVSVREVAHRVTVSEGNYAQLCVLCHQMDVILDDGDLDTGNGLSGVHEVGSNCRTCHTHGEAIQAGL
ncbi:MAG: hypothetical protein GXP08_06725 [Gammaproteobacteria bacterium]|nr:hypothetical protein [Gammaproteobacteria bacterium]